MRRRGIEGKGEGEGGRGRDSGRGSRGVDRGNGAEGREMHTANKSPCRTAKSSVAKHYGFKRARHCAIVATQSSEEIEGNMRLTENLTRNLKTNL